MAYLKPKTCDKKIGHPVLLLRLSHQIQANRRRHEACLKLLKDFGLSDGAIVHVLRNRRQDVRA